MTLFCLTGTPGTGKTSVANELRGRGYRTIDGSVFLKERDLLGSYDRERDTYEVDLDRFNTALDEFRESGQLYILDSHLSHFVDSSGIIVLRCAPNVLAERLRQRVYSVAKITENVQAEILDTILCEATETDIPVAEIDCSLITVKEAADAAEKILHGECGYEPGSVDWTSEIESWF